MLVIVHNRYYDDQYITITLDRSLSKREEVKLNAMEYCLHVWGHEVFI